MKWNNKFNYPKSAKSIIQGSRQRAMARERSWLIMVSAKMKNARGNDGVNESII